MHSPDSSIDQNFSFLGCGCIHLHAAVHHTHTQSSSDLFRVIFMMYRRYTYMPRDIPRTLRSTSFYVCPGTQDSSYGLLQKVCVLLNVHHCVAAIQVLEPGVTIVWLCAFILWIVYTTERWLFGHISTWGRMGTRRPRNPGGHASPTWGRMARRAPSRTTLPNHST